VLDVLEPHPDLYPDPDSCEMLDPDPYPDPMTPDPQLRKKDVKMVAVVVLWLFLMIVLYGRSSASCFPWWSSLASPRDDVS
jgi:hypothetical protein